LSRFKHGSIVAMVTLTYPSRWQELVPTAAVSTAHLQAFRHRLERAIGPVYAILRREYQRRGAPHWHIQTVLPQTIHGERTPEWISHSWYSVVRSEDPKHLAAGTGVDWSYGIHSLSSTRIARYFAGYSAGPTAHGKGHQDQPPDLWVEAGSVGRFWSVWRLKPAEASLYLNEQEFIQVRRLLRRIDRAKRRTRVVTVRRINRRTGEIKYRRVNRRADTKSLNQSRLVGGSLFVPDGPRLTRDVRRFIQSIQQPESETT